MALAAGGGVIIPGDPVGKPILQRFFRRKPGLGIHPVGDLLGILSGGFGIGGDQDAVDFSSRAAVSLRSLASP